MTLWTNNLNGIASGTAVTTANSGGVSGTAFSAVSGGGAVTAQAAAAFEGACGLQLLLGSGTIGNTSVAFNATAAVGTRLSASFWYRFANNPASLEWIVQVSNVTGLKLTSTGTIQGYNSAGINVGSPTPAITPGTWLFIQAATTPASTTSTGRLEYNVTTAAGATLLNYDSGSTANAGTAAITSILFGRAGFNTAANTYSYDLLNADNTLTTGFPGSPAPANPYDNGQFFPFF